MPLQPSLRKFLPSFETCQVSLRCSRLTDSSRTAIVAHAAPIPAVAELDTTRQLGSSPALQRISHAEPSIERRTFALQEQEKKLEARYVSWQWIASVADTLEHTAQRIEDYWRPRLRHSAPRFRDRVIPQWTRLYRSVAATFSSAGRANAMRVCSASVAQKEDFVGLLHRTYFSPVLFDPRSDLQMWDLV